MYLKDIPDAEVDQLLESKEKEAPRIVVFRRDGEIIGTYIVGDKTVITSQRTSFAASFIVLVATYYVFNLEYPRVYSQLLGLFQTYVIKGAPYNGKKSSRYIDFSSELKKQLEHVESKQ